MEFNIGNPFSKIGDELGDLGLGGLTKSPSYLQPSPYQRDWAQLIQQLRMQAAGQGPSLAEQQYLKASQNALYQQAALSHGRSPGAARAAANNMSNISLGQAQGAAEARLAEQMQATAQLNAALSAANQADYQRQYANQQAQLQTPTQFQQIMGIAGQAAGMAAMMNGPKPQGMAGMNPIAGINSAAGVPSWMTPTPMGPDFSGGVQGATYGMQTGNVPMDYGGLYSSGASVSPWTNPTLNPWGNGGY